MSAPKPLAIDVDGTLIHGDLTHETLLLGIIKNPLRAPALIAKGLQSKPKMKADLVENIGHYIDAASLPYNETVLAHAHAHKKAGGEVVLCSGSEQRLIDKITGHFDWIDAGYGTTSGKNLTRSNKAEFLQSLYPDGFHYIGNSTQDYPVWTAADKAFAIAPPAGTRHISSRLGEAVKVLEPKTGRFRPALKAMRLHQWAKNALIFLVPALTVSQLGPTDALNLVLGFIALGLLASGTYLFNDLLDIQNDRQHHSKKARPFASGRLSILDGLITMLALLAAAMALALFLPPLFSIILGIYFISSLTYSTVLKRIPILDVLVLALLFTLRVIAGAVLVTQPVSPWLVSFILTFFLSLSLAKRYTELVKISAQGKADIVGRGYQANDKNLVLAFGMMATALAIMSYILYAIIADAPVLASHWSTLIIGVILIYWIMRMWFLADRGEMHDDPVLFALKDRLSLLLVVLVLGVIVLEQVGLSWLGLT